MIDRLRACFIAHRVLYTRHARYEMRTEEFGFIHEQEVYGAVLSGEVIEDYPDDQPYPSVLIDGHPLVNRPLHIVCAYSCAEDMAIVMTVYHPRPDRWIDHRWRQK